MKIVGEARDHMPNKAEAQLRRFFQSRAALKETLELEVVEKAKANPLTRYILMEVEEDALAKAFVETIMKGQRSGYEEVGCWFASAQRVYGSQVGGETRYRIWIVYVPEGVEWPSSE